MSDSTLDPAKPDPAKPAAQPPRKRKWRRRLRWAFIVLVLLAVVLRIALVIALPKVLEKVAADYGLACTYERLQLSLTGGDVGLWHLHLAPREGGAPYVHAEYLRGNISTFDLLRGRLVVHRVIADGVDLNIERAADGSFPLLKRFTSGQSKPAPGPVASTEDKPQEVDFTGPVTLDAFRVQRLRCRYIDRTATPPFEARLSADLRLSDVRSGIRPVRFEMDVALSPLLDSLRVDGEARTASDSIDATVRLRVDGVRLKPIERQLAAFGLRPVADRISAELAGHLRAQAIPATQPAAKPARREMQLSAKLSDASVHADSQQAFALGSVAVEARMLPDGAFVARSVTVSKGRAFAERDAAGRTIVAGLALVPPPTTAPTTQPSVAPAQASAQRPAAPRPPFTIEQLALRDLEATLLDRSVSPASPLSVIVESLDVSDLTTDPAARTTPVQLAGRLRAPGIAERIELSGSVTPFAPTKTADLSLRATDIRPDALRPYVQQFGLQSELASGTFACRMRAALQPNDAGLLVDAGLTDVKFDDGRELLSLSRAAVAGVLVDTKAHRIRIQSIDIDGPRFAMRRRPGGAIAVLGFQTAASTQPQAPVAGNQPVQPPPTTAREVAPPRPPTIEIGRFTWQNLSVQIDDDAAVPPTTISVGNAGLEIAGLLVDPAATAPSTRPATMRFWLTAPGLVRKFTATGTVAPGPTGASLDLDVRGEGLSGEAAASYLGSAGLAPAMRDGSLRMKVRAGASVADGATRADLAITDIRLEDGGAELVGVDALRIENVDLRGSDTQVGAVRIERPRLHAMRQSDGALVVAGLRMPARPMTGPASPAPPTAVPPPGAAPAPASRPAAGPQPTFALNNLLIQDAQLRWADRATTQPVDVAATVGVSLDHLMIGRPTTSPAKLSITATADGILDKVTASGSFTLDATAMGARVQLSADGIRAGAMSAYLPPGIRSGLKDGRFRAALDASVSDHPSGGKAAKFAMTDLDFREANADSPMLHVDSARIGASRLDPPGRVIALDEIAMDGLDIDLQAAADGSLQLLGLSLSKAPEQPPVPRVHATPASPPAPPAHQPAASPVVRVIHAPPPLVTLNKLDLNVRQARFTDRARAGSAPLALSNVRLRNLKPIALLGDEAESRPAVELSLTGSAQPLAQAFTVKIVTSPFATEAALRTDLLVTGIRGQGLTDLMPNLRPTIDGSGMSDGRLRAQLEATFRLPRRTPLDLDFARGVEGDILLKQLAFQSRPDGPVLAGVDEVQIDGLRLAPGNGLVAVKAVQITKPIAHVRRDEAGIHVLGWVIKPPSSSATRPTSTTALVTTPVVASTPTTTARAASTAPGSPPSGEFRVDRILVSGLDVSFTDTTMNPPLRVPLTGLDVEVRDVSSRAMFEDRPIRFAVALNAGKVSVPKRPAVGGLLGLVGAMAQPASAPAMEDRELFSEIAASGRISLHPQPKGWIKSSVGGLELAAFSGAARQAGVTLGGGTFDNATALRLPGDGSMDIRTRLVMTDLKLSEPSDGPIRRLLVLPSPLDVAIGAMEDASGSITIPLDIPVRQGGISGGAITGEGVKAIGGVLITAIASAPVKAVGGVASLIGIGGKGKAPPGEEQIAVAFGPGQDLLDADNDALRQLIQKLRDNKKLRVNLRHELGQADIERTAILTNLSPEDCARLAEQLRRKRLDLLESRAALASAARAHLVTASDQLPPALAQLRSVEQELSRTEDALDHLFEMLRPGADRQADRRTRAACIELGQQRLSAIEAALLSTDIPDIAARVRVTRARFAEPSMAGGGAVTAVLNELKAP